MTKSGRILAYGAAGLLVIAGGVGGLLFGDPVGQAIALALVGVGLVVATSLVFFEVGLSEDRERARRAARPERKVPRSSRPDAKLGRMRGRPRRLR